MTAAAAAAIPNWMRMKKNCVRRDENKPRITLNTPVTAN